MKLDFSGQHSNSLLIADWGLRNADLKTRSQETGGVEHREMQPAAGSKQRAEVNGY